jgi:hypothetical protein
LDTPEGEEIAKGLRLHRGEQGHNWHPYAGRGTGWRKLGKAAARRPSISSGMLRTNLSKVSVILYGADWIIC